MPAVPHRFSVVDNEVKIAAAYNQAGYRHGKYADGSEDKLFCFGAGTLIRTARLGN
jgi:hypothetical protein